MRLTFLSSLVLLVFLFVAACGGGEVTPATETPTPAVTPTPDLCMEPNLSDEVNKVHKLTREFDDYAALASNTPQNQLVVVIPEMQRILREAEDQSVPPCLTNLKDLQISHMKTVVQTLLAFVGKTDPNIINAGIAQARELHAQYDVEMARILGVTFTVPSPMPTVAIVQPTATPAPIVTNSGPNELNLRNAPDFNAPAASVLSVGGSAVALGRTADNQWILVQVPDQSDQNAWVYATVVQISVPLETLPVVTP